MLLQRDEEGKELRCFILVRKYYEKKTRQVVI